MGKKYLLLYLLFFGSNGATFAQPFKPGIKETLMQIKEVIPVKNKGFVVSTADNMEQPTVLGLQFCNLDAQLVSSQEISVTRQTGSLQLEGITAWNNSVIVLTSLYYAGPKRNTLLLHQYSLPDLELVNSKKLMETYAPADFRLPFLFQVSPDESKLLVSGWSYGLPNEEAKILVQVLDTTLHTITNKNFRIPYKNERLYIEDCQIDNDGNAYVTGENYRGSLMTNYQSPLQIEKFIIAFFAQEEKGTVYELKDGKKTFGQLKFDIDQQQNLIGSGFYKIGAKLSAAGTHLFKLAPSTQKLTLQTSEINKTTFKNAFSSKNTIFKTPKNNFSGYELKEVIIKEDAYYLIGERYQEGKQVQTDIQNAFLFNLQDILVIKLDKKGQLKWITRIPKIQNTSNILEKYFSFTTIERSNKLYFFFNDNEANYGDLATEKIQEANYLNAGLVSVVIDLESGLFKRRTVKNFFPSTYLIKPIHSKIVSDDLIILYGTDRKELVYNFLIKTMKLKR